MEEKRFVTFKKEELAVKDYVKRALGKGKISNVSIEYTPVGERIVIATSRPGLVIGRRGEKIDELTQTLKKKFKLDNPHIDIREIMQPMLDAQLVADDIALMLERDGSLKFKVIAYRTLQNIMGSGALGAEIVMSGKLPSERAKSWRFASGFLKKTGDPSKVVLRAMSQAKTLPGVVGIKVSILPKDAYIHDKIVIDESTKKQIDINTAAPLVPAQKEKPLIKKKIVPSKKAKAGSAN
jgi:small subunit ribosomal protein S3